MKQYEKPTVEAVCEMKAETVFAAQSWNNGKGTTDHSGTGNDGVNYNNGETSNQTRNEQNSSNGLNNGSGNNGKGNNGNNGNNGKGNGC